MISPLIERDPTDGQITVAATELRVAVTPWANLTPREIDTAFVQISVERASVAAVLTREECIAISRQFAEIAEQISARASA